MRTALIVLFGLLGIVFVVLVEEDISSKVKYGVVNKIVRRFEIAIMIVEYLLFAILICM